MSSTEMSGAPAEEQSAAGSGAEDEEPKADAAVKKAEKERKKVEAAEAKERKKAEAAEEKERKKAKAAEEKEAKRLAAAEKKAGGPKLYGEEVSRRNKPSAVAKKKKLEKLLIDKEVNKIQKEEMTYQEMIDAGWEMTGEGIWWPPQPESETVSEKISFPKFRKKVAERKPEKAQDAGARARRAMKRKEHAKYVSGSEDNVPDDIRD